MDGGQSASAKLNGNAVDWSNPPTSVDSWPGANARVVDVCTSPRSPHSSKALIVGRAIYAEGDVLGDYSDQPKQSSLSSFVSGFLQCKSVGIHQRRRAR